MSSKDEPQRGPTPPRGWRPGPVYILAAACAIVLLIIWLVMLAAGPSTGVEPLPQGPPPASTPTR